MIDDERLRLAEDLERERQRSAKHRIKIFELEKQIEELERKIQTLIDIKEILHDVENSTQEARRRYDEAMQQM